jgi:hypothetical protein
MRQEIKNRLEDIVALLNDPDTVVLEKEVKEKLGKILLLLDNPEEGALLDRAIHEKLKKVVDLVNNAMVDPDIDIEHQIPSSTSDASKEPYILVTYVVGEYNKPTRKIRLANRMLQNSAEEIVKQITSSIEEFKSEIDSVEMG